MTPYFADSLEWDECGSNVKTRGDRSTVIRRVPYEVLLDVDRSWDDHTSIRHRVALTLNIGHGGMLVLMDNSIHVGAPLVLNVAPVRAVCPTACPLAEVAWTHPVPFAPSTLHFVGLRFLR